MRKIALFLSCCLVFTFSCDEFGFFNVLGPPSHRFGGIGTSPTTGALEFVTVHQSLNNDYSRVHLSINGAFQQVIREPGRTRYTHIRPGSISFVVSRWRLRYRDRQGFSLSYYPTYGDSFWVNTGPPLTTDYILDRHTEVVTIRAGETVIFNVYL